MSTTRTAVPGRTIRLRKRVKSKKPRFARQESWKYVRLKENWRRPKGLDNKVRKRYKGWPPRVSAGYRGPKASRSLHPSGFKEVLVHNADHLDEIDPKIQAARIAHTVGKKERANILTEARKKKIQILNLKQAREIAKKEEEPTEVPETKETVPEEESKKEEKAGKRKKRTEKK